MTKDYRRLTEEATQGVLLDDPAFLREIVERKLQEFLEAEMTEHVGPAPYELTTERKGHRNGHKPRTLRTRVGTLNLLVPQDREGTFSTRKVKSVTERLCGTSFSKSPVSSLADHLDSELQAWRSQPLEVEAYPYLFVDPRYEKVRVGHRIVSQGGLDRLGGARPGRL